MDEHGWADVDELGRGISRTRPFTRDMLEEIVTTSSRATGRVGQMHRALPGKEIPLQATASTQGRLKGAGIGFVIAFGVIGNTKTQVVDVLELHGLYYVINR